MSQELPTLVRDAAPRVVTHLDHRALQRHGRRRRRVRRGLQSGAVGVVVGLAAIVGFQLLPGQTSAPFLGTDAAPQAPETVATWPEGQHDGVAYRLSAAPAGGVDVAGGGEGCPLVLDVGLPSGEWRSEPVCDLPAASEVEVQRLVVGGESGEAAAVGVILSGPAADVRAVELELWDGRRLTRTLQDLSALPDGPAVAFAFASFGEDGSVKSMSSR